MGRLNGKYSVSDARFGDRDWFNPDELDRGFSPRRPPYIQHPDADNVCAYLAHDDPLQYLREQAGLATAE